MATPRSSSSSSHSVTICKQWDGSPVSQGHKYHITLTLLTSSQQLQIEVDAPFHDDLPPPHNSNTALERPLVGLWEHEVAEIFISDGARENYLEINLGPHGHYFANFFTPYEEILVDADRPAELRHYERDGSKRWSSRLQISTWSLPEPDADFDNHNPLAVRWFANFYAIYGPAEGRTFLAYQPIPGTKPNFHQPHVFVPFVLAEAEGSERRSSRCGRYSTSTKDTTTSQDKHSVSVASQCCVKNEMDITRRLLVDLSVENVNISNLDELKGDDDAGAFCTGAESMRLHSNTDKVADRNSSQESRGRRVSVSEAIEEIRQSEKRTKELPQPQPSGLGKFLSVLKKEPKIQVDLQQFLLPEETILMHGLCWKRKGWSWHRRILVLTTKTRILYLTPSGRFRGQVPWSFSNSIRAIEISSVKFDIELKDKSRVYHFNDEKFGSERWITAINKIAQAMQSYYETTRSANRPASLNTGLQAQSSE